MPAMIRLAQIPCRTPTMAGGAPYTVSSGSVKHMGSLSNLCCHGGLIAMYQAKIVILKVTAVNFCV